MYAYGQELEGGKWVRGYNGNRVLVRRWVNGQWQITREGENYFRYNKNDYVVSVPIRRAVRTGGGWLWARGLNQRMMFPVANRMQHVAYDQKW